MPLAIILVLIQIAFVVHVVKSGRDRYWIYLILFVPAIGCAVYFITQVLPEMGQSRTVRHATRSLLKAVDPERELRRRKEELAMADTIDNRMRLAEECIDAGFHADAIGLLLECLRGSHQGDPHILMLLARARFDAGYFEDARATLEQLIEKNPEFKSHDGHLLYARTLESLNLVDAAAVEYEVLQHSFPGEEARVRYALMLARIGETEKARRLFNDTLMRARRAPKYYRVQERPWLTMAEQNLAQST
ncbi:MAG TPA: tetratricopeptide repeat protein [Gammaproteobacteria bacterium]